MVFSPTPELQAIRTIVRCGAPSSHARRRDTIAVPFNGANERERFKELPFQKALSRRSRLVLRQDHAQ